LFTERTSVGLDVHARSVVGAGIDGVTGELFQTRLTPAVEHICSWLGQLPGPVAVTYEAGPTGFGLYRSLSAVGIRCVVAAPSKLVRPAGDRVKTDANDAVLLARLLRLDEITPVAVPTLGQETARDLARAREDCRGDLMRARHRLSKLLLRHGLVYYGGKAWTIRHDQWLRQQRDRLPADPAYRGTRIAFDAAYDTVAEVTARRGRLDAEIAAIAADSELTDQIRRLSCLRGIETLTAFGLLVELGDLTRFTGSGIGAFVGLAPGEHSTGSQVRRGPITRAGNTHARRLLIEAAWHHRKPYRPSKQLRDRWSLAPTRVARRADQANRRLRARWQTFDARSKKPTIANTAIARELAGWCWSLAVMD
jgi:transposase